MRFAQGSYVLNNFLERLSGHRLYERLHDVLLDTGTLQSLRVVDNDWPSAPTAPQVGSALYTALSLPLSTSICRVTLPFPRQNIFFLSEPTFHRHVSMCRVAGNTV